MAYCRFSKTCKVYMYSSVFGGYQFHVSPTFNHPEGLDFNVDTAKEALHRLKRLQTQGYGVPQYAIDRLEQEIADDQTVYR